MWRHLNYLEFSCCHVNAHSAVEAVRNETAKLPLINGAPVNNSVLTEAQQATEDFKKEKGCSLNIIDNIDK